MKLKLEYFKILIGICLLAITFGMYYFSADFSEYTKVMHLNEVFLFVICSMMHIYLLGKKELTLSLFVFLPVLFFSINLQFFIYTIFLYTFIYQEKKNLNLNFLVCLSSLLLLELPLFSSLDKATCITIFFLFAALLSRRSHFAFLLLAILVFRGEFVLEHIYKPLMFSLCFGVFVLGVIFKAYEMTIAFLVYLATGNQISLVLYYILMTFLKVDFLRLERYRFPLLCLSICIPFIFLVQVNAFATIACACVIYIFLNDILEKRNA